MRISISTVNDDRDSKNIATLLLCWTLKDPQSLVSSPSDNLEHIQDRNDELSRWLHKMLTKTFLQ